jgi:hypothetical protein
MNVLSKRIRSVVLADHMGIGTLWTVEVDGQVITDHARPFDAGTATLVLNECDFCFHCGMDEISVRRIGTDVILWYVSLDDDYDSKIPKHTLLAFERIDYERVAGGVADLLPELSAVDISNFLPYLRFPDWHLGLYTTPALPNDWLGQSMLRLLSESLASSEIQVAHLEVAGMETELRIGIDLPGIPETIVRFRSKDDKIWFQIAANPWIPAWFSHAHVTAQLPGVLANSELAL